MASDDEPTIPETRVLAIASHVAYGYVGNTMATFVMQSLGCEVTAINTVNYSNHTAYKQVKGKKTTAEEIEEIYEGLQQSYLNDFDMMLSGYIPSADAVRAVGKIGRDLKLKATTKPGSFFWILDPVMGDDGRLYIPEDEVPAYRSLLREADLILPNQFEAELLADTKISSLTDLAAAIRTLHTTYQIPHIIITSLRLSPTTNKTLPSTSTTPESTSETLTIIGSTAKSDHTPRLFRIDVPAYPVFFSGTGDMFAALTVARLREAAFAAGLQNTRRWISSDDVGATELPLARAAEKVLASMQAVLGKTAAAMEEEMAAFEEAEERAQMGPGQEARGDRAFKLHLRRTRAAEVRVVRNVEDLRRPREVERFRAREVEVDIGPAREERVADALGVVNLSGKSGEGMVHVEDDRRWGP